MRHPVWSRSIGLLLLGACTPLGLWLYEGPVVTVSRITLQLGKGRAESSPVIVALAVHNLNDYPLSAERVELSLRVDGVPIGHVRRDSTVPVAMDTISTVALALALEGANHAGASRIAELGHPHVRGAGAGYLPRPLRHPKGSLRAGGGDDVW